MATVHEALERIWNDPSFKKSLFANPRPVLAELGMSIPAGQDVRIWENSPHAMHFVIPDPADVPPGFDPEAVHPVLGKVIKRAWKDPSFRTKLMSDPREAVEDASGVRLPATLELHMHEDTAKVKNLVLPVNPADENLSDADLEALAGGVYTPPPGWVHHYGNDPVAPGSGSPQPSGGPPQVPISALMMGGVCFSGMYGPGGMTGAATNKIGC